jgi:putative (di)nucleoside polyphosphate hydrolase
MSKDPKPHAPYPVDSATLPYRPCVGIMVLNHAGHVWLGCRADAKNEAEGRGAWWQMPQGGIDGHEDPKAAARRELFEETAIRSIDFVAELPEWLNYDLPPDLLGKSWGGRYRGQTQKWFAVRFLGDDSEISIAPAQEGHPAEFVDWRWAPVSELLGLIVPFKRQVYVRVLEAFGPLATPLAG